MGRTKKPCPGCGEVSAYRSADKVCPSCHTLITEALAERERRKADATTEARKLPFAAHGLPYIHHMKEGHLGEGFGRKVQEGFYKLFQLLAQPAGAEEDYDTPPLIKAQETGYDYKIGKFPVGFSDLIEEIYTDIVNGAAAAYRDGYADGQNLLAGLAKGEVSIEKFNEVCADIQKPAGRKKLQGRRW